MFAFFLATLVAAAGEPAYMASCPAEQTRVLSTSAPVAPDNIHPTNRRVRFLLDIGSDGRLRHASMTESSGDATFDAAALDAVGRFRFAPQTQGCISTSSVVPEEFNVPLLALARPAPGTTGIPELPSTPPESSVAICTTAFVQLTGLDVPDTRQAPGTVAIDVGLDAAAHVTSAKLAKSSGNPKTDATGTALARDAQYAFTLPPGCRPKPTVYRLELTFH
jgi:TonB family protein